MSLHTLLRMTVLALLLGLLPSCTEEQLLSGLEAERAYVDLLQAVHAQDQDACLVAIDNFDEALRQVGSHWYRRMPSEDELDDKLYHIDNARFVYEEVKESVEAGDLVLASVQLDRATYELWAADPEVFQELYVGSIYDFITSWLEVDYAVNDMDLCMLSWPEFGELARHARFTWRSKRYLRPSPVIYPADVLNYEAFRGAHDALDARIDEFVKTMKDGDQCRAQQYASEVTESLWALLDLFDTPGPVVPGI